MQTVILPRQTTIYTCGAACLAAVARLQGYTLYESDLAQRMNARPVFGIDNDILAATALIHGAEGSGECFWDGEKLAILNVLNPLSKVGHYVVALRMEGDDVIAYCPYYANTLRLSAKWLEENWTSGDAKYLRWAITFPIVLDKQIVCIGEAWPEMGLAAGEVNPHWMLRSAKRAIDEITVKIAGE